MKIVVTGSSGHIGGAIVRHLHEQGHEVTGISRKRSETLPKTVVQYGMDIAAPDFLDDARQRIDCCDAVIHAAACMEIRPDCPDISRVNCLGTQQVAMLAGQWGATHLLYISGLNLLGLPRDHPITESHPVAPADLYAASKLYSEHVVALSRECIPHAVSLRVSSPVGPGLKRRRIVRIFIEQALKNAPLAVDGTGRRRQDYVDVRDIANAVSLVIAGQNVGSDLFNIASGNPVSNLELAQMCVQTLQSTSTVVFSGKDDPHDHVSWDISIDKASRMLGYAPRYALSTSIAAMAEEMKPA